MMKPTIHRVPIQLHSEVMACLRHYLKLASSYYHKQINEPLLIYRNKGSIAGSAYLQKWQIQLNTPMLLEYKSEFIQQTVPHELAHLITYQQYGKEWQFVMQEIFSRQPTRTHHFHLPEAVTRNRYRYQCNCQTHNLTTIRHNRIKHNLVTYCCKKCGSKLRYQEN